MKTKEFVTELVSAGCTLVRHGSSHDIWYSPMTNKTFAMPRHGSKEMPTGTEKKIRKEAGI